MKTNSKPLVSIIVPVYNTNPIYLEKCLDSIKEQSYKKVEIIIVDDGSNVLETQECLKKREKTDSIKVIHRTNGGVSAARNTGLRKAIGEYVLFIDADDYIEEKYVGELVKTALELEVPVVIPKVADLSDGKIINTMSLENGVYNLKNDATPFIKKDPLFSARSPLFLARIAKKEQFNTDMRYGEDTEYTVRVLNNNNFAANNKAIYFYVKNDESVCANYSALEPYVAGMFTMYSTAARIYPEARAQIMQLMWNKINRASMKLVLSGDRCGEYVSKMKIIRNRYILKLDKSKNRTSIARIIKDYLAYKGFFRLHFMAIKMSVRGIKKI